MTTEKVNMLPFHFSVLDSGLGRPVTGLSRKERKGEGEGRKEYRAIIEGFIQTYIQGKKKGGERGAGREEEWERKGKKACLTSGHFLIQRSLHFRGWSTPVL